MCDLYISKSEEPSYYCHKLNCLNDKIDSAIREVLLQSKFYVSSNVTQENKCSPSCKGKSIEIINSNDKSHINITFTYELK